MGETADVVELGRGLALEMEPDNGTELLQSHGNPSAAEKLLLRDEQKKWFLEMVSTPGEDAVKIADKSTSEFERTDTSFERISTVGKVASKSTCVLQRNCLQKRIS